VRCAFCGGLETRVVDSRMARDGRAIRRRRHCEGCGERFTTYEVVEMVIADVEKRHGGVEPFDAEKLVRSMRLACKKRPVEASAVTSFVERLEARISARPRNMITSAEIGEAVLAFLRDVDPVAYVRYSSVYRSFSSVDEFLRALQGFGRDEADDAPAPPTEQGPEEP